MYRKSLKLFNVSPFLCFSSVLPNVYFRTFSSIKMAKQSEFLIQWIWKHDCHFYIFLIFFSIYCHSYSSCQSAVRCRKSQQIWTIFPLFFQIFLDISLYHHYQSRIVGYEIDRGYISNFDTTTDVRPFRYIFWPKQCSHRVLKESYGFFFPMVLVYSNSSILLQCLKALCSVKCWILNFGEHLSKYWYFKTNWDFGTNQKPKEAWFSKFSESRYLTSLVFFWKKKSAKYQQNIRISDVYWGKFQKIRKGDSPVYFVIYARIYFRNSL